MGDHPGDDAFFKMAFENPIIVESLITTFLPAEIWAKMDFSTLALYESGFKGEDGSARIGDKIWRVRLGDSECYLMIMLEFQRRSDYWMAVRFLAYAALLWQSLIRTDRLKAGDKLPLILPVVLYNGRPLWKWPVSIAGLLPALSPELGRFQPAMEFFLLDAGHIELPDRKTIAACLAHLTQAATLNDLIETLRDLSSLVTPELDDFQRLLISWLAGNAYGNTTLDDNFSGCETIEEACNMLTGMGLRWEEEFKRECRDKAIQEGIQEGLQQGIEQGRKLGEEIGRKLGEKIGLKLGEERGIKLGEERGIRQERRQILEEILNLRFGELPSELLKSLSNLEDIGRLRQLNIYALNAPDLSAFMEELGKID